MQEKYVELIRYATLAPSGHNTQPWKFQIKGDTIRITADTERELRVVDPSYRELYISLGCALENLVIAAAQFGFESRVTVFPAGDLEAIHAALSPQTPGSSPMFDAITKRQSTRNRYDGNPVPTAHLEQLQALSSEPETSIRIFTPGAEMDLLIQRVVEGDLAQYSEQDFLRELAAWIRFNQSEAAEKMDGLSTQCLGNPSIPRWLGKVIVRWSPATVYAKTDKKNLQSSSGLALFTTGADDRTAWINIGRTVERFALTATTLGLKMAFMNQPIEVDQLRSQIVKDFSLSGVFPQLLVRFGYASEMPRSLRTPLDQILTSA